MKKLLLGIFLMGFVFVFVQGAAQATLYSFGDESIHWPGWKDNHYTSHNTQDVVGTPNLRGGVVDVGNDGYLDYVKIFYSSVGSDYSAGDLFIDLDGDQYWDYVVHNTYSNTSGHYRGISSSKLYQTHIALDSQTAYLLSQDTWHFGNHVSSFRNDHPTVLKDVSNLQSLGNVSVTDFDHNLNGQPIPAGTAVVFDFTDITSGTNWNWGNAIIGFSPTCSNDVIYSHVPEPATVLLIGFGLVGLGLCSSSKMRKG